MKKFTLISLLILFSLLFLGGLYFYLSHSLPSGETVEREFLEQYPNTEFVSAEMIFDWEPRRVYSYLVKYKQPPSDEILSGEFAIKQHWNFQWQWCSEQTERKCD